MLRPADGASDKDWYGWAIVGQGLETACAQTTHRLYNRAMDLWR